jgi:hypothetical protein
MFPTFTGAYKSVVDTEVHSMRCNELAGKNQDLRVGGVESGATHLRRACKLTEQRGLHGIMGLQYHQHGRSYIL